MHQPPQDVSGRFPVITADSAGAKSPRLACAHKHTCTISKQTPLVDRCRRTRSPLRSQTRTLARTRALLSTPGPLASFHALYLNHAPLVLPCATSLIFLTFFSDCFARAYRPPPDHFGASFTRSRLDAFPLDPSQQRNSLKTCTTLRLIVCRRPSAKWYTCHAAARDARLCAAHRLRHRAALPTSGVRPDLVLRLLLRRRPRTIAVAKYHCCVPNLQVIFLNTCRRAPHRAPSPFSRILVRLFWSRPVLSLCNFLLPLRPPGSVFLSGYLTSGQDTSHLLLYPAPLHAYATTSPSLRSFGATTPL